MKNWIIIMVLSFTVSCSGNFLILPDNHELDAAKEVQKQEVKKEPAKKVKIVVLAPVPEPKPKCKKGKGKKKK